MVRLGREVQHDQRNSELEGEGIASSPGNNPDSSRILVLSVAGIIGNPLDGRAVTRSVNELSCPVIVGRPSATA
jgi:hypothetical protein